MQKNIITNIFNDLLEAGFKLKPFDQSLKFPRYSTRYYDKNKAGKYIETEIASTIISNSTIGVKILIADRAALDPIEYTLEALQKLKKYGKGYFEIDEIRYSPINGQILIKSDERTYKIGQLDEDEGDFIFPLNKILKHQKSSLRVVILGQQARRGGWDARLFLLPIGTIIKYQKILNISPEDYDINQNEIQINSDFDFSTFVE